MYLKNSKTKKTWFPVLVKSRSKFHLIPFHERCLKITTDSILKSYYIAHARRMSQFQTQIRSRDNPLNTQTLIVVFIDAPMPMPELING